MLASLCVQKYYIREHVGSGSKGATQVHVICCKSLLKYTLI